MSSPRIDKSEVCIMHTSFYVHLYMYAILKSVYLYRPQRLPAGFKKCTPIPAPATAGNLSKMHTYIYPVLSCCKLCTPIPATITAGSLLQKMYTYTGHHCRRQSFKSVHLYIPRSDLLQIVYTYTSPGICRHPFLKVYTYMYPDAARTLPAALTL